MRFLPMLAALTFALAGCTGLPPGAASAGDEVTVSVLALDAQTGHPVGSRLDLAGAFEQDGVMVFAGQALRGALEQNLGTPLPDAVQGLLIGEDGAARQVVPRDEVRRTIHEAGLASEFAVSRTYTVGSGQSGLGSRVEAAVIGVQTNGTARVVCGPSACTEQRTTDAVLGPFEMQRSIARGQFESALGAATEGMEFQLNELYDARVTTVTEADVAYRILAVDGQEDPAPAVGAVIVTRVMDDTYDWVLEPDIGATFIIRQASGFQQQTPLGLEPGAYKTVGKEDDRLVYAYTLFANTELFSMAHVVEVTVTAVDQGVDEVPKGEFGKRDSPVLRGMPELGSSSRDGHDHGADDHDHGGDGHGDHEH